MNANKTFLWALLLALLSYSCTDLTPLNKRLEELENRVSKLEAITSEANNRIENIQKLLAAEAGKVSILSYEKTDNGYDFKMSDGSTLSLFNGKSGKTPDIGVTELNGKLYWTIDGVLLRDADKNPIIAKAQDGRDGATPRLQVDKDGYWMMSSDDGKTWIYVKDKEGNNVRAKGRDATETLSITETDAAVIIKFGGKTYTISKVVAGGDNVFNPNKMALEYVTEYGVAVGGKSFATTHTQELAILTFEPARDLFAEAFLQGYHLANYEEWVGIFPEQYKDLKFSQPYTNLAVKEKIQVGSNQEPKNYTAEYKGMGNGTVYGIKFIDMEGNKMRTAYKYRVVNETTPYGIACIEVSARLIGNDAGIKLESITASEFWTAAPDKVVTRIFPMTDGGRNGLYWTSTVLTGKYTKGFARAIEFNSTTLKVSNQNMKNNSLAIRPFTNF